VNVLIVLGVILGVLLLIALIAAPRGTDGWD
jgi:hypothetical protein